MRADQFRCHGEPIAYLFFLIVLFHFFFCCHPMRQFSILFDVKFNLWVEFDFSGHEMKQRIASLKDALNSGHTSQG